MAQPDERAGQVVPFPTRSADVEPAQEILDGEIVDEAAELNRSVPRWVPATVVRVARHEPTRRTARTVAGVAVTIGQGFASWGRRTRDARTLAPHNRAIRAAEMSGDLQVLGEFLDRREAAADQRHRRRMELPKFLAGMARIVLGSLVVFTLLTLVTGLVVQLADVGSFLGVVGAVFSVIAWCVALIAVLWTPFLACLPLLIGFAAWREGRKVAPPTQWATGFVDGDEGREIVPSDGAILEALRHLGISKLNDAFKRGWGSVGHPARVFEQGTAKDGKGWRTQIRLPQGVNVEMINRRKAILAHNLVRLPVEVWPTEPKDKPGVLDLWVAEPGSLTGPPPAWPLLAKLDTVQTDYFKGVPAGVNIRGDNVNGLLSEANYAMAGIMGSGKSSLAITLLLGALLDPLVDADVVVMAENSDFEPMKPRLRSLRTGPGLDTIEHCMALLREAYNDLEVRGQALKEHDERAVTRRLAEKDDRLRPRIILIDECQALFMDETYGEEAANVVQLLISAARKYAFTLIFLTPEPSTASLPRKVITLVRCKACFAIGDQQSNDAILGTGSYRTGISAVDLEPKTDESNGDVGTSMVRGFMPKPGLLRSYFVNQADAHRVTARAMQIREKAGITGRTTAVIEAEQRDLLEDVAEVLGGERVNAADVPALLRDLAPNWAPYRTLDGVRLRKLLAAEGVKVPSTNNRYPVDPAAVRRVLAERSTADLDEE
ncbi:zonular occludens toxin domain-containing protein [Lentzea sp. NPDC005914]|uniref:zonular occludens toxin domain-containing protein n=1 Tax=Lentzea sp. NPDC005914 TaxID=3154572 RepID=UPI0033CA6CA9